MKAARLATLGSVLLAVACATVDDIDASNSPVSSTGGGANGHDGASVMAESGGHPESGGTTASGGATSAGGTPDEGGTSTDASPGEAPDAGPERDASVDSGAEPGSGGRGSGGRGSGGNGGSSGGNGGSSGGGGSGGSGPLCNDNICPSCLISGLLGSACCKNATTCGCRPLLGVFPCG